MTTVFSQLKSKIAEQLKKQLYFNQPYMDPDDPKCTSSDYFKEISYFVNLKDLYDILDSPYYHADMPYVPVFLRVGQDQLRQGYDNNEYLIQVWNKQKQRIFQVGVQSTLKQWAICFRYLVYTLNPGSTDSDCIHIVDLENNNAVLKVRGFGTDDAATEDQIKICKASTDNFGSTLDVNDLKVRTITPGLKIHGLLLNKFCVSDKFQLVAYETSDNILDFNRLFVENFDSDESFTYRYTQYREVVPRGKDYLPDPIVKSCFTFNAEGYNYSIALRKSGGVDIYWNMLKIESTEGKNVVDINMTPNSLFFKLSDGNTYGFDHKDKYTASFQQIEPISPDDLEWENIIVKKIHNTVYLYKGIKLLALGNKGVNSLYISIIAHGKFVSIYDIAEKKWTNHMTFVDDIEAFFSHQGENGSLYTSLITKKGLIYTGFLYNDGTRTAVVPENWKDAHAEGSLMGLSQDWINQKSLFVIHKKDDKVHLSMLYKEKLQNYDHLLTQQERVSVVCILYTCTNAYFIIQNGSNLKLMQTIEKEDKFQPILIREFPEFPAIKGTLHSGAAYQPDKHLFLFDEKNLYVIKTNPPECITYENVYCIGIQSFTKSYTYALCQDSPDAKNPGLRVFDMESIINRNKSGMVLVKKIDVGTQGSLDYTYNLIRMGMVKSLTHLVIFPILHRNVNKFMAMSFPSDYMMYKVMNDTMIAMTNKGQIFSWNVMTGKILSKNTLEEHDYSNYDVYSKFKKNMILLRSKDNIQDIQDCDYFEPHQFKASTDNQAVFIKQGSHTYKRWKWIEIMSETEVKVHLEYIHPHFSDWQYVFLNKEKDRMIEVQSFFRCFFYRRVPVPGQPEHVCKWELIRRIADYPTDLQVDYQRLEFFSPSFSRYIVADKKAKQYVIKDSYIDREISRIPIEIMTFEDANKANIVINRFKWIDETKFLIINEEGIEKIIDIEKGYNNEVEYNYRPLFNEIHVDEEGKPTEIEWEKYYYYLQRADLAEQDTLKRLQRIYQQYKTSYFLFNKRSANVLYQDLMNVDPYKFNYNELSFTFLHWSLIEQIQNGQLTVEELEDAVIQQILYNFLPGGNTVLHILADCENELINILKRTHPDLEDGQIKYHVPFLPNLKGQTPIHRCIEKQDYKSIDTILKYLKFYPTDHHSRGLKNIYGDLIEKDLPEFLVYLDSRFQETEQTKKFIKGCLKSNSAGIAPCELWFKEEDFKNKLMTVKPVETRIKCEFMDLPGVYHYLDDEFQQFFEALSSTENMEYFDLKSIQKLVDFNYPLVREYIVKKLFIPFCCFQLIFFIFMNMIYAGSSPQQQTLYYPFLGVIVLFATYFMMNEVKQLSEEGIGYLASVWNYIDLIPPIGIYVICVMILLQTFNFNVDPNVERGLLSVITFFMWFKFLYFLRIFKNTGYLIRMIVEVVKDMRNFFLVLLITIAAFGDSFLRLSLGNTEDAQFTTGFWDSLIYTYRMILGDFDTGAFGDVAAPLVMILFLLCTIFNMIVMLNLLIAIISDSYAKVTGLSVQATYQERASMITENHYLIPDERKIAYAVQSKYLMVVTDLEGPEVQEDDPLGNKLETLKDHIESIQDIIQKNQNNLTDRMNSQDSVIKSLQVLINRIAAETNQVRVRIHKNALKMVTFEYLRSINANYKTGWFCDAKKLTGCRGAGGNGDMDGYLYHCDTCDFDYCAGCYEFYGNDHKHEMEKITLRDLNAKKSAYTSWGCDGRHNTSKCQQTSIDNGSDILYHDPKEGFDLCQGCAEAFKIE